MRLGFAVARAPLLCTVLVAAVVSACSSMDIDHSYDRNADFSKLTSYDWKTDRPQRIRDPRFDSSVLHSRIRDAVERQLGGKGFQRRAAEPDFLISYFVKLDRKVDVSPAGDAWADPWQGPQGAHSAGVQTRRYEQGTLILDIVDPVSTRLLWRGTAAAELSLLDSQRERRREVDAAVRRILAPFPPS